jgi:CDP-archaeol synthase
MHPILIAELLVLVGLANALPVLAKKILGTAFAWPLDGGATLWDGGPLFGHSKTIRGVVVALLGTPLVAVLMGLGWELGLLIAASAMAGDLLSSFIKRRLALPPSSQARGLDQIPESLFPFVAARWLVPVSWMDVLIGTVIFVIAELVVSRILYRLNLRDRPY